jgi:hypothetical protein
VSGRKHDPLAQFVFAVSLESHLNFTDLELRVIVAKTDRKLHSFKRAISLSEENMFWILISEGPLAFRRFLSNMEGLSKFDLLFRIESTLSDVSSTRGKLAIS